MANLGTRVYPKGVRDERPDKIHASELHYSREDIMQFKIAYRIHTRHLSLANGTDEDATAVFQGCELTGIENLRKSAACKGCSVG